MTLFTLEDWGILDGLQAYWTLKRFDHVVRECEICFSFLSSRGHVDENLKENETIQKIFRKTILMLNPKTSKTMFYKLLAVKVTLLNSA